VSGTAAPVLGAPKRLFTRPTLGEGTFNLYASFEMTGDGAGFLTIRPVGQQGPPQGVAVIQNWAAEFAKKR
jgi:hypothetical protein